MSRKESLVSGSFKHPTNGSSLNFIFLRINSVYELFKNVCEKNKDKKISKSLMALGIEKESHRAKETKGDIGNGKQQEHDLR
jgi:hypothetical protein